MFVVGVGIYTLAIALGLLGGTERLGRALACGAFFVGGALIVARAAVFQARLGIYASVTTESFFRFTRRLACTFFAGLSFLAGIPTGSTMAGVCFGLHTLIVALGFVCSTVQDTLILLACKAISASTVAGNRTTASKHDSQCTREKKTQHDTLPQTFFPSCI